MAKMKEAPEIVDADYASLKAENEALKAELAALKGASTPEYKPYPSVRYHPDGRTVTVLDEAGEPPTSEGWTDAPCAPPLDAYPAWRYHKTDPPKMVRNAVEDAALGP